MTPPTVLHINNEPALDDLCGFVHDFAQLSREGHLVHVPVAPRELAARHGWERVWHAVASLAHRSRPDVILVQSPHAFRTGTADVRRVVDAAGRPPVLYWEGDPWGGRKRLPSSSQAWLHASDQVFSIAMGPQRRLLRAHTRAPIRYVPNVLAHGVRPAAGDRVPDIHEATLDVTVVGSHRRVPLIGGQSGTTDRQRLVRGLQRLDCKLAVYGVHWRGPGAMGTVPYAQQIPVLQRSRLTAGTSHFAHYQGNFSDRLPNSLYAGRVHVTCRVPGADWLPGPDDGLHQADSPARAVRLVQELLREDPAVLHAAGVRGHHWVRDRLSSMHALCYMLGHCLPVPPPPSDPWKAVADFGV